MLNREARYKLPNRGKCCNNTIGVQPTKSFCCRPGFEPGDQFFFGWKQGAPCLFGNSTKLVVENLDGCIEQIENRSYYIWQYFTVSNSSKARNGDAKNAVCKFCDKPFRGCCTTRAAATVHSLGRPLLGQTKAGIVRACVAINKKNDERRAVSKNAQRAFSDVMRSKEETVAGRKRKQAVMDGLLTPCSKKPAKLTLQGTQKSGSK